MIVDVDAHHYENESYKEVFQYIESPVIRHDVMDFRPAPRPLRHLHPESVGNQNLGGRITRSNLRRLQKVPQDGRHRDVAMTVEWMDALGVDYACLFPTPMLFLGTDPRVEVEVALAAPITAGSASESSPSSRASNRCSICRSTIPRPPIR